MGNKNYSQMDMANYRYLDTIDDPQLGEVKLYKNLCFNEFIARKSFIFASSSALESSAGPIEQ